MNEAAKFEIQEKKLQNLCDEHGLIYKFASNEYPITLTIQPTDSGAQMRFDTSEDDKAFNPNSAIVFSFEDGDLTYRVSESFTLSENLLSKLKNIAKKMHSFWVQFFYRDIIEKGRMDGSPLPSVKDLEDEADEPQDDLPEGAAPLEDIDGVDADDLLDGEDLPDDDGDGDEDPEATTLGE